MSSCVRSGVESAQGDGMIEMRRAQLGFGDGLIADEVSDLREDWMRHADQVLADEQIVAAVYDALAKRHAKSRSRGRLGTPAEVVLRLLILKHIRNWSYAALEREVRANLVYRDFTRVGAAKMPDAKTMGRWGVALGPLVLKRIHEQMVRIARDNHGTANARGYDSGRDQHPPSNRQYLAGGRGAGAEPHHEEDHCDCRRDRNQAAGSKPECEAAGSGDCAGCARQRADQSGQAEAALSPIAGNNEPGGGTGKALLKRSCRRRKAVCRHVAAARAGWPAPATRYDVAAGPSCHAADAGTHLPRQDAHARQDPQPVRARNRSHPHAQGRQT